MELERSERYEPLLIRRGAVRQIAEVRGAALVERAALEADEDNAAYKVDVRISNGYRLGLRAVHNAAQLNRYVTEVTRDNPTLEMEARAIEAILSMGTQALLHDFITRR